MFNAHAEQMFRVYGTTRSSLIQNPEKLIAAEKLIHDTIKSVLEANFVEFKKDYDEASCLYPFWQNYPPEDRGRSPRGDQFPWIEVGEHSVGCKMARFLSLKFTLREIGLPSGPDQRFLLRSQEIDRILGFTDALMVLIDVKSVGPRDDFEHTVLSPFQVSGDGLWRRADLGVKNSVMMASGARTNHPFHCALPPIYVTSDLQPAPTISVFVKPVYSMLQSSSQNKRTVGQPLERVTLATLPNGILLTQNPNYLQRWPGLFFPGKDDKSQSNKRRRARVSFAVLKEIADWRVQTIGTANNRS